MRSGEAAAPDGGWIPIMWLSISFHAMCGGTIVVYAELLGWESLSGFKKKKKKFRVFFFCEIYGAR